MRSNSSNKLTNKSKRKASEGLNAVYEGLVAGSEMKECGRESTEINR